MTLNQYVSLKKIYIHVDDNIVNATLIYMYDIKIMNEVDH